MVSTLENLVLQSEQYHPVAPTHLHKGLKYKINIFTNVRPQKYCPALSYTNSMGMAAIPIERDAAVWGRLRMRICPVTNWGFECCQYHGELTARGPSRKKSHTPSAEIQTEIQKSTVKSRNPI